MNRIGIVATLFFIALNTPARAEDFSGRWQVNANGLNYVLEITQLDDSIFGTMITSNSNRHHDLVVAGKINDRFIRFSGHNYNLTINQQYEGYLSGSPSSYAITGTFMGNNRRRYRWHAIKE